MFNISMNIIIYAEFSYGRLEYSRTGNHWQCVHYTPGGENVHRCLGAWVFTLQAALTPIPMHLYTHTLIGLYLYTYTPSPNGNDRLRTSGIWKELLRLAAGGANIGAIH
jgi:hypothetical protein